jgi:hypothetical protein
VAVIALLAAGVTALVDHLRGWRGRAAFGVGAGLFLLGLGLSFTRPSPGLRERPLEMLTLLVGIHFLVGAGVGAAARLAAWYRGGSVLIASLGVLAGGVLSPVFVLGSAAVLAAWTGPGANFLALPEFWVGGGVLCGAVGGLAAAGYRRGVKLTFPGYGPTPIQVSAELLLMVARGEAPSRWLTPADFRRLADLLERHRR